MKGISDPPNTYQMELLKKRRQGKRTLRKNERKEHFLIRKAGGSHVVYEL